MITVSPNGLHDFESYSSSALTTMKVPPLSQTQSESYVKSYFHEFGKSLNEEVKNCSINCDIKNVQKKFKTNVLNSSCRKTQIGYTLRNITLFWFFDFFHRIRKTF